MLFRSVPATSPKGNNLFTPCNILISWYIWFDERAGIARVRLNSMLGHLEVPQNFPVVAHPVRLLPHKQKAFISLLESTLPQVFILNNLKSFRINTYAKTQGRDPRLFPPSNPKFTRKETSGRTEPTIFRTFFQVPYPLSPLFATLTKTAGVYLLASRSGTHRKFNLSFEEARVTDHGSRVTTLPQPTLLRVKPLGYNPLLL